MILGVDDAITSPLVKRMAEDLSASTYHQIFFDQVTAIDERTAQLYIFYREPAWPTMREKEFEERFGIDVPSGQEVSEPT